MGNLHRGRGFPSRFHFPKCTTGGTSSGVTGTPPSPAYGPASDVT